MTCEECGAEMRSAREDYVYTESGLPNVLLEGIEIRRCTCGEEEIVIPRIKELHRLMKEGGRYGLRWVKLNGS